MAIIWNFTDGLFGWGVQSVKKKKSKPRSVIVFLTEQIKSIDLKKLILEPYLEKKKDSFFFPILYWVWKHAKTIPLISAKKSVLRLIRQATSI